MRDALLDYITLPNNNGLLITDMPTGYGKTYNSTRAIYDYIYKYEGDKKQFFITNLKKNLPVQELKSTYLENDNQSYNKDVLLIKSNYDYLCDNFLKAEIPSKFKMPLFKDIEDSLTTLKKLEANKETFGKLLKENIEKQIKKLKEIKPHIIIGSPGRILDLIKKRKITAHTIKTIVLDEADNLLSKNKPTIIKDIIKSTMKDRQLMFFSASINKETLNLAKTLVKEVEIIKIENKSEINPRIEHICILGSLRDRFENLRKLLAAEQPKRAIVFVNNNTELRQINEKLQYHKVKSTAIYGNASKEERQRALDSFRRGKCNVLVSSDLSARGLDIPEVSHIISLDFPVNPNEYLHRAGRTARGNNSGVSLCLITNKDIEILQSYEKAFGIEFTVKKLYGGKLMDMEQQ